MLRATQHVVLGTEFDQIAQPHLEHLTAESLGVTDAQFALINDVKDEAIRSAHAKVATILEKRAEAAAKKDEKKLKAEVQLTLDANPDNRTRKKREELSMSATKSIKKEVLKIDIAFD
jgi:hypothetical protein